MSQVQDLPIDQEYKYGFETDVEQDILPPGLDEDVIRTISAKKGEPEWLTEYRLNAFAAWKEMTEPHWAHLDYEPIDYKAISYFAVPKKVVLDSLDDLDPEIKATFDKLGIPLDEQKMLAGVAVDAVFDSVSVATTFRAKLARSGLAQRFGVIFELMGDHANILARFRAELTIGEQYGPRELMELLGEDGFFFESELFLKSCFAFKLGGGDFRELGRNRGAAG